MKEMALPADQFSEGVTQLVKDWADRPAVSNRLLTIIVPKKVDTSRLTQLVRSRLQRDYDRPVFSVDLRQLAIPQGTSAIELERSSSGKITPGQWLKEIVSLSQQQYGLPVRYFDRTLLFAAMLDSFVLDLSEFSRQQSPILIVDGLEDVTSQARNWAEDNLLQRFLGRSSPRAVMVLHDEHSIQNNKLRWEQDIVQIDVK
jgi:hypothetical protein